MQKLNGSGTSAEHVGDAGGLDGHAGSFATVVEYIGLRTGLDKAGDASGFDEPWSDVIVSNTFVIRFITHAGSGE